MVDVTQAVPVVVQPPPVGVAAAPAAAAASPASAVAVAEAPVATSPAPAAAAPAPAAAVVQPEERPEVSLDQEVFDKTLAELLAAGTDRRIAEGKARRAGMIAARKKASGEG